MNKLIWLLVCGFLVALPAPRSQAAFGGTIVVTAQDAHTDGFTVKCQQAGMLTSFHVEMRLQQPCRVQGFMVKVVSGKAVSGNVFWVRSEEPVPGSNISGHPDTLYPRFRKIKAVRGNDIAPHPVKGGLSFDFTLPTQDVASSGFVVDISYPMPSANEFWLALGNFFQAK